MKHIKIWIIRKLGGFETVDSAIEAIQELDLPQRKVILSLAVRRLFNTIGSDDILKEGPDGRWMSEGRPLPEGVSKVIIEEAKLIMKTRVWQILERDVKYQANRRMFLLGKTDVDMIAGKLWLYTLDAFKTRLESLADGSPKFNDKKTG